MTDALRSWLPTLTPRGDDVRVIDLAQVQVWLEQLGFEDVRTQDATLRCHRATEEGDLFVYVRASDDWLIASVVPFLETGGENSFELARWLLRQNRDMQLRKFAYDEDGDVVLTVEVPTEALDFSEVEEALLGLVADAVRHRATLRAAMGESDDEAETSAPT